MRENTLTSTQETFVKMALDAWHSKTNQLDKLLAELSDEQLLQEVAPSRNRGVYLLGHLTSLADSIFPLLGYEKQAGHLFPSFVQAPDAKNSDIPSCAALRQDWIKVKTALESKIASISSNEWFQKHTAVAEEDFIKEPHRNKLNVVLSRVGHMDYHIGQLIFLKNK